MAGAVLGRIVSGAYPCGLRLPSEAALAEELGCGRSTVREALRHVGAMGVIRSRRGSGAMVLDFRRYGTPALLPAFLEVGRFGAPTEVVAKELLRMRTVMACEAVRLAARYGTPEGLAEARAHLDKAPALESDPVEHACNELEIYRALVVASGIWPAAWLVNAFWGPLHEVHRMLAPVMGPVRSGFQKTMTRVLALIAKGDERAAVTKAQTWFDRVDAELVARLEQALAVEPNPSAPNGAQPARRARKAKTP